MKTKEELNALKEEVETVSRKLRELTEEELAQVAGGMNIGKVPSVGTHSSLSLPDMVAELEKHGLANLGEEGTLGGGLTATLATGAAPFAVRPNNADADIFHRIPSSSDSDTVEKAVEGALMTW